MKITTGKVNKPYFMVLYGPAKIGKTTFASKAKDAIIIGPEDGSNNLNVSRSELATTFSQMMAQIKWLLNEKHSFKTAIVDSITKLEPMVWEEVCALDGSSSIETAQKGFGKGYVIANKHWQEMINALFELREKRQMNIIAIAHSVTKSFNDPLLLQPYDRYMLQMNDKAAALWTREVDCLAFANSQTYLNEGDTEKKNRAVSNGKRILYLTRTPNYEAGNRLGLPDELPLDFEAFESALNSGADNSIEGFRKQLLDRAIQIKDEKTRIAASNFIKKAATMDDLNATLERLNQIA